MIKVGLGWGKSKGEFAWSTKFCRRISKSKEDFSWTDSLNTGAPSGDGMGAPSMATNGESMCLREYWGG